MRVVVNAAMSVDGKLATHRREQLRISGPADFDRVDALRADVDAVLVGVGTVLADDPSLTVDDVDRAAAREAAGRSRQPARVVADSRARTPIDARVLDEAARTYVLVSDDATNEALAGIEASGAEVIRAGETRVDLALALDALEAEGISTLLAEGGGELIFSLFEAELVDELSVYVAPMIIGGRSAPTLVDGDGFVETFPSLTLETIDRLDSGVLLQFEAGED